MAQGHMSVDTVEGSSVLQMRDEPTSVDAGNSEFFRATEASSSNVISSSPSASHDRARPLSESFYSCSQSSKEHNGECSADVPMTPTGEETAEATSESAERVAGFFTKDQAAKILLQIAVGMSQVDNYTTHRDRRTCSSTSIDSMVEDTSRSAIHINEDKIVYKLTYVDPIHEVNLRYSVVDFECSVEFWRALEILRGIKTRPMKLLAFSRRRPMCIAMQ